MVFAVFLGLQALLNFCFKRLQEPISLACVSPNYFFVFSIKSALLIENERILVWTHAGRQNQLFNVVFYVDYA